MTLKGRGLNHISYASGLNTDETNNDNIDKIEIDDHIVRNNFRAHSFSDDEEDEHNHNHNHNHNGYNYEEEDDITFFSRNNKDGF